MSNEEKINKIKEILRVIDGVSDSQEFGLAYGQAIYYINQISEVLKEE